jgi:hypothetical protein
MITIGKPYIEAVNEKVYLKANITDEQKKLNEVCNFVTQKEYGKYFCDEVSDAFITGLLLPALQSNQDIVVKGAMSEKLFFNLSNTLIFLLSKAFNCKPINIIPDKLVKEDYKPFAVGTGCSLGIDSFSTIIKHTAGECPESYKLTHLTYFNVGAHGEVEREKVNKSFQKDLNKVKDFVKEVQLPLLTVESNLPDFYKNYNYNFDQTHVIRNMSMVLALQKLFVKYIYSSGFPLQELTITGKDLAYFQAIILPYLTTESTELIDGDSKIARTKKTLLISANALAQKHLYVCVKDLVVNNQMQIGPWVKIDTLANNCAGCEKCLRTLSTLEILGEMNRFSKVFDLKKYAKLRKLYFAKILGLKTRDYYSSDIYNLALERKFKFPFISKLLSVFYSLKINELFYRILTKVKK